MSLAFDLLGTRNLFKSYKFIFVRHGFVQSPKYLFSKLLILREPNKFYEILDYKHLSLAVDLGRRNFFKSYEFIFVQHGFVRLPKDSFLKLLILLKTKKNFEILHRKNFVTRTRLRYTEFFLNLWIYFCWTWFRTITKKLIFKIVNFTKTKKKITKFWPTKILSLALDLLGRQNFCKSYKFIFVQNSFVQLLKDLFSKLLFLLEPKKIYEILAFKNFVTRTRLTR